MRVMESAKSGQALGKRSSAKQESCVQAALTLPFAQQEELIRALTDNTPEGLP